MPTLGFHVPDGSELQKKIVAKAQAHDGKVSSYVRQLVEKDLNGEFIVEGGKPVEQLAKQYHSALWPHLEKRLAGLDQVVIIDRFLEALTAALKRSEFNPESPYQLFNDKAQLETIFAQPGVIKEIMAEITRQMNDPQLHAAEEHTPYGQAEAPVIKARKAAATGAAHKPAPTPPTPKRTAHP